MSWFAKLSDKIAGPKRRDTLMLLGRLGPLLTQDLAPIDALAACAKSRDPAGRLANSIVRSVGRGNALSAALARHAPGLASHELAALRAGEKSGCLNQAIAFLISWQARQAKRASALRSALAYPAALLSTAVGSLVFLATTVVPSFAELYSGVGSPLPTPAAALMAFGGWLKVWGFSLLGSFLATTILLLASIQASPLVRFRTHQLALNVPALGRFILASAKARASSLCALLLQSGCELENAFHLSAGTASNDIVRARLERLAPILHRGQLLSDAWKRCGLDIDGSETVLLGLAEQAGGYQLALEQIAQLNDQTADTLLLRFKRIVEPGAVVLAAASVALGASAVYGPLLNAGPVFTGAVS